MPPRASSGRASTRAHAEPARSTAAAEGATLGPALSAPRANARTHDLVVQSVTHPDGQVSTVRTWLPKIKLTTQSVLTLVADVMTLIVVFGIASLSTAQETAVLALVGGLSVVLLGGDLHAQGQARRALGSGAVPPVA